MYCRASATLSMKCCCEMTVMGLLVPAGHRLQGGWVEKTGF
jgi:hypothetical protein